MVGAVVDAHMNEVIQELKNDTSSKITSLDMAFALSRSQIFNHMEQLKDEISSKHEQQEVECVVDFIVSQVVESQLIS